jgi:hypothetical protein
MTRTPSRKPDDSHSPYAVPRRGSAHIGIAVAGMVPVLFLILERVFSPQHLVMMLVAWAITLHLAGACKSPGDARVSALVPTEAP